MTHNLISHPMSACAVLWDLDGTLIDTANYHWLAWSGELAGQNRQLTMEEFSASFGKRNDTILNRLFGSDINPEEIQRISDSKETRYRRLILENPLALLPGVSYWFAQLHSAGWGQALATMTGRKNVEAIFSVTPIQQYLTAVVTGNEVAHGKPDPEVFLRAAEKLDVLPGCCIVVEDSLAGIEAASRAGMKSIGVNKHISLPADLYIESLDRLPDNAFQNLLSR
jgi:beta-phosphoglucomutase